MGRGQFWGEGGGGGRGNTALITVAMAVHVCKHLNYTSMPSFAISNLQSFILDSRYSSIVVQRELSL